MKTGLIISVLAVIIFVSAGADAALKDVQRGVNREKAENRRSGGSSSSSSGSRSANAAGDCLGDCLCSIFNSDGDRPAKKERPAISKRDEYVPDMRRMPPRKHKDDRQPQADDGDKLPENGIGDPQPASNTEKGFPPFYTAYPYSNHRISNWVYYPDLKKEAPFKTYRRFYTFEAGGQHLRDDNGNGGFAGFHGTLARYLYLDLEYKRIEDSAKDHLDLYNYGLTVPVLLTSGFSPGGYFQGSHMRGILHENGISWGFVAYSYPVRPLSFMVKFGRHKFEEFNMNEMRLRAGVHLFRVEFFAGYQRLKMKYTSLSGPEFGVRLWL